MHGKLIKNGCQYKANTKENVFGYWLNHYLNEEVSIWPEQKIKD